MKKGSITILFFLLIFQNILAQKEPMKFGKIDKTDLEMTVYPADSSAAAVILCEYGYYDPQLFQFTHLVRIKILKEEGKQHGNFFVPASEKTVVKGQTVNIENGIPVITKLNKESVFIEKITKDYFRARVAMPNVKVGSVIDVEFFFEGFPTTWYFQQTIPIRWSEYVESNPYLEFKKHFVGYRPLTISTSTRWVASDVPAFKPEAFISNIDNYLTHFNIDLSSINISGYHRFYSPESWEAVAEGLRTSNDFGMNFQSFNLFLNTIEKEIKSSNLPPEKQLEKAFYAIKTIKWDHRESMWPSSIGLDQAYSKKLGNSADINLILTILLRRLGLDASPVILSTRQNGLIPTFSVSIRKMNYVLAHVNIEGKTYLLDATEENLPINVLPERAINGQGFLISKESFNWVDLSTPKKDKSVFLFNLSLTPDGEMKGSLNKTLYDYAAYNQRNLYKTFNNQDEYLKSVESKSIGLSVEDYSLTGLDSLEQPIKEDFKIILKNRVTKANNQLFICPIQMDKLVENPFKAQERVYPVDFITPIEKMYLFRLELPTGFTIEQLPQNIKMTLPENSANFQMQSSVNENMVQVLFKININKSIFLQNEYADLKAFYNELIKKQAEMLIIKKI